MPNMGCRFVAFGGVVAALLAGSGTPSDAQNPTEGSDWNARTIRRAGQPVIPAFEGWYQKPDGTYNLCFGYWSGNSEQALDIPIGPDNFIEPSQFNGAQPTHFMPVPRTGYRKHYCVFTINVPEDFGSQRVVWTLRVAGETFSVPGHTTSTAYVLDEPDSPSRAAAWMRLARESGIVGTDGKPDYSKIPEDGLDRWLNFNPGQAQGSIAPVLRFLQPAGPEVRGRDGVTAGPVSVAVGAPLTLSVFVDAPDKMPARWWVGWWKYQGPGDVTFSQHEMETDRRYDHKATTTATFSQPGNYTILVQSIDNVQSFERQCCWTNGYIRVTVTP